MEIICDQCEGKFKIADDKVPKGKTFSVSCPKCKNKISVDARSEAAPAQGLAEPAESEPGKDKTLADAVAAESYDASEKPFDFVEEGVETALLCEPDAEARSKLHGILEGLGYQATEPAAAIDALKQMRFHVFDLIVLNEMFDTDDPDQCDVLKYLDQLSMEIRRNIFVTLITNRFRTMDNMAAFNKSVNLIINTKNLDEIEKILRRGVAENASFYKVFKESLISTGRV